eukprot:71457-Hanusia_phi.AAC.5
MFWLTQETGASQHITEYKAAEWMRPKTAMQMSKPQVDLVFRSSSHLTSEQRREIRGAIEAAELALGHPI